MTGMQPQGTLVRSARTANVIPLFPNGPELRAPNLPNDQAKKNTAGLSGRLGSWHLPAGQTLEEFCTALNDQGINYAILPSAGGALDSRQVAVLVDDDDIRRVRPLLTRTPLGLQLAVYSTTGLPGFSFQQHWRHNSDATNMAVLPPYLAEVLLSRAQVGEDGCRRIPTPDDALLWEIYRALYLVGDGPFAASAHGASSPVLVGPAAQAIRKLAGEADVSFGEPLRLEELDEHLTAAGWEPPHDVMRRLSSWNSWAASKLQESLAAQDPEEPGMVAFFVRREVVATGLQSDIAGTIEACGFELLQTIDLDDEQIEVAARAARGANWGGGALPVNGGPPVSIIIAYDVFPSPVPEDMRDRYPFLDNGRALVAKLMCRQLIRDRMPPDRRFNPVHSTDDSLEAWRVVRMFAPEDETALRQLTESRKAAMTTNYEVVKTLTRKAARAKVELIRYKGGLAVKKTFRENCLRFLEREASFMDAVSPDRPEILPVLERGRNYFIMPFVEGRSMRQGLFGRSYPKLMTLRQIRTMADLLRYLFSRGYDPIDLAPHNLIVDGKGQLTAIDFEFVHRTDAPIEPEKSACLNGIPDDFEGEWPAAARWSPTKSKARNDPYRERWFGYTGLSRKSFLHDAPPIQAIKRAVNYPHYLGAKATARLLQWVKGRAKHGIKRGMPVISRIAVNAVRTKGKWS